MKILITNDDGIDSVGIIVLAEIFGKDNDIIMVAPRSQRSAFSHSITISEDITVEKHDRPYPAYAISGTPADCTKIAISYLNRGAPFDLVLSGINNGPNLGTDILYSGTVAAATEGAVMNVPSIAVSLQKWNCDESVYRAAATFLHGHIERLTEWLQVCKILNINYPVTHSVRGMRVVPTGFNRYDDCYYPGATPDSVRVQGMPVPSDDTDADTDLCQIRNGYVTVTPLSLLRDDAAAIRRLGESER